jgi:hypothetical protein
MSLFRDRPPCSRRRAAEFLEGVKKEISVAHVTLSKRCVMNSWRRASTGFTGFTGFSQSCAEVAFEYDAACMGTCTVSVHFGAPSYARIGRHAPRPNTLEQHAIQRRLLELGVRAVMSHRVVGYEGEHVAIECTYTARRSTIPASSVLTITSRLPNDDLYEALAIQPDALSAAGIVSVNAIGDCLAPGTIAAAVYAGHRYAREFDLPEIDQVGFRREMPG